MKLSNMADKETIKISDHEESDHEESDHEESDHEEFEKVITNFQTIY